MVLPTSSPMTATKIAVGRNNQKIERAQKHRDIRTVDASKKHTARAGLKGMTRASKKATEKPKR